MRPAISSGLSVQEFVHTEIGYQRICVANGAAHNAVYNFKDKLPREKQLVTVRGHCGWSMQCNIYCPSTGHQGLAIGTPWRPCFSVQQAQCSKRSAARHTLMLVKEFYDTVHDVQNMQQNRQPTVCQ